MGAGPGGIVGNRVKLSVRGMVGCWQSLGKRGMGGGGGHWMRYCRWAASIILGHEV